MTFVCTSWWPLHVSVETCWYKYYSLIFIYTDVIILNIFYTFKFYLPTTAVIWRVPAQNKLFQYNRKTHLFSEHFCSRRGHAYICKVHRRLLSNLHHKGPPPPHPTPTNSELLPVKYCPSTPWFCGSLCQRYSPQTNIHHWFCVYYVRFQL